MLTIAFDQATVTTGWSVFLNKELVEYGRFNHDGEIIDRMSHMVESMINLTDKYIEQYPKEKVQVVIEDIQLQRNALTFKQLAQLQGAVLISFFDKYKECPTVYSSSTWKSWNKVEGKGRAAQKRDAQKKIEESYGVKVTQDEADSILLGRYAANNIMLWG